MTRMDPWKWNVVKIREMEWAVYPPLTRSNGGFPVAIFTNWARAYDSARRRAWRRT